jgi:phage/plasmid-associated DNA primase
MSDGQLPDDPMVRLQEIREQRRAQSKPALDTPPEFSDDGLALEFANRHHGALRHVAKWSKWLLWSGSHWQEDDTLRAFDFARAICRDASTRVQSEKLSAAIASAKAVAAVVSLARADRRLAQTVGAWDCDQGALNTPDQTISLPEQPS